MSRQTFVILSEAKNLSWSFLLDESRGSSLRSAMDFGGSCAGVKPSLTTTDPAECHLTRAARRIPGRLAGSRIAARRQASAHSNLSKTRFCRFAAPSTLGLKENQLEVPTGIPGSDAGCGTVPCRSWHSTPSSSRSSRSSACCGDSPGFDFAAGKFPFQRVGIVTAPLADQNLGIAKDQRRDDCQFGLLATFSGSSWGATTSIFLRRKADSACRG